MEEPESEPWRKPWSDAPRVEPWRDSGELERGAGEGSRRGEPWREPETGAVGE